MEMFIQGSILHLVGMGAVFILMIIMLSAIGKGVTAASAGIKTNQPIVSAAEKTNDAVIAAITAAVNEYRKTN